MQIMEYFQRWKLPENLWHYSSSELEVHRENFVIHLYVLYLTRTMHIQLFKNLNKWWLFLTVFFWLVILSRILFNLNSLVQPYFKNIFWYPKLIFPPISIFRYYLIAHIFVTFMHILENGSLCAIIILYLTSF